MDFPLREVVSMSNALKRKGKPKPSFAPLNITNYQTEKIAALVGVKTNALMAWQEAREKEITDATVDEFNEKLCRAEDYLAFANVLISMYAIKMTWGFTRSQERFLQNLNAAHQYIKRIGEKEAFRQVTEEWGTSLEFDDFEIQDILDDLAR